MPRGRVPGHRNNRHAKFLLLQCAFEQLGCEQVEFEMDVLNAKARKGLIKIGAIEEGVLRRYNYMPWARRGLLQRAAPRMAGGKATLSTGERPD